MNIDVIIKPIITEQSMRAVDSGKYTFVVTRFATKTAVKTAKKVMTPEQVEAIVAKIEQKVRNLGKWEVKSEMIGRLVMKELLKLDKVAYLRFASVCKSFDDPALFEKELSLIQD